MTGRVTRSGRVAARQVTRLVMPSVTVPVIGGLHPSVARARALARIAGVAGGTRAGDAGRCRRLLPVIVSGVSPRAARHGRRQVGPVAVAGHAGVVAVTEGRVLAVG